jgi:hypothetical protein
MAVLQSIDDAREERIGRDGVTAAAYADALAHSADALAWIRRATRTASCLCCGSRRRPTILPA